MSRASELLNTLKYMVEERPKSKWGIEIDGESYNSDEPDTWPKNIKGNLYLNGNTTYLPDGLTVGGYLKISNNYITKLPGNLKVGDLFLSGSRITELPDGLTVEGDIYLVGTKVTKLSDNLTVGGNLFLNAKITSLPDNLKVGGSLVLTATTITELPDNLKVGRLYLPKGFDKSTVPDHLKGKVK